jgi:pSer/pThr/pTyr-binding forkhead associated (FHA) protein
LRYLVATVCQQEQAFLSKLGEVACTSASPNAEEITNGKWSNVESFRNMANTMNYGQNLQTSALPQVELEILKGRANRKIRRIDVPVYLIGSAPDCDLVLADSAFPEVHTYVYVTKQGVSVRRLGEGPELKINGEAVQSASLQDGERVQLGTFEFTIHVVPAPHDRQPASNKSNCTPVLATETTTAPGVAEVFALLADIRATLRIESSLKLYIEPEAAWQHGSPHMDRGVRKATA